MHDSVPYREISLVSLLALGLFAVLSIGSYSPTDSAFSYTADTVYVNNLVGQIGARFADLALSLFGWVAWLLPVVLVMAGWRLVRHRGLPAEWLPPLVRTLGWSFFFASACLLMQLHFVSSSPLPAGTGGLHPDQRKHHCEERETDPSEHR